MSQSAPLKLDDGIVVTLKNGVHTATFQRGNQTFYGQSIHSAERAVAALQRNLAQNQP